jgi:tetratricopeptide (TPR) repeat protein
MANSGRAEEAIQYYYRALELNPAYIRARWAALYLGDAASTEF